MGVVPLLAGCLAMMLCGNPADAQSVLAARTIRANSILTQADVTTGTQGIPGVATSIDQVIGLEARVAIYRGHPIRRIDLGAPALIDRNQAVTLFYRSQVLTIATEGRALGRGGAGDQIRVMNMSSRSIVVGTIAPDGNVYVLATR